MSCCLYLGDASYGLRLGAGRPALKGQWRCLWFRIAIPLTNDVTSIRIMHRLLSSLVREAENIEVEANKIRIVTLRFRETDPCTARPASQFRIISAYRWLCKPAAILTPASLRISGTRQTYTDRANAKINRTPVSGLPRRFPSPNGMPYVYDAETSRLPVIGVSGSKLLSRCWCERARRSRRYSEKPGPSPAACANW